MKTNSDLLYEYAVKIRRQLHRYPEIGFALEKTVRLVSDTLDALGISYTYQYGEGSVVAELGQGASTVALRADMDALPIDEKTDLPYKSEIPGAMHACGHDAHTAVLLAVAKYLKENEAALRCRVRLIFQPSEEGAVSGAKMMVDNGVCDGVSHILCTHCENTMPVGKIGIRAGDYMAACVPLTVRFLGKTSHATLPQFGIDANAMAVEAYQRMREAVKEEAGDATPYIWSVGRISGGQVHNVISELCEMDISFRFYDMAFAGRVEERVKEICTSVAARYGGKCEVLWNMSVGPVTNDPATVRRFEAAATEAGLSCVTAEKKMSSEDFGWYLTKIPGMLFRFGTKNAASEHQTVVHNSDFCLDEQGMRAAIRAFCAYVMSL